MELFFILLDFYQRYFFHFFILISQIRDSLFKLINFVLHIKFLNFPSIYLFLLCFLELFMLLHTFIQTFDCIFVLVLLVLKLIFLFSHIFSISMNVLLLQLDLILEFTLLVFESFQRILSCGVFERNLLEFSCQV